MNVTTRGKYGVKAMFELTLNRGQGPIPLKMIAENQGLSEHYLEQLIAPLRKAGLVKSVRGAYGGYLLAQEPKDISVGDILRVLEGPLAPSDCALDDDHVTEHCGRAQGCMARNVWIRVRESIQEVVDSISMEDLYQESMSKDENNYMYYI